MANIIYTCVRKIANMTVCAATSEASMFSLLRDREDAGLDLTDYEVHWMQANVWYPTYHYSAQADLWLAGRKDGTKQLS